MSGPEQGVGAILRRRRAEQDALVAGAQRYLDAVQASQTVRAGVVFGSVARGDFNVWSDVDVLLLIDNLPDRPQDRAEIVSVAGSPGISAVAWTTEEFVRQHRRGNPIARESAERGIFLSGEDVLRELVRVSLLSTR